VGRLVPSRIEQLVRSTALASHIKDVEVYESWCPSVDAIWGRAEIIIALYIFILALMLMNRLRNRGLTGGKWAQQLWR